MNFINGGVHAESTVDFQEYFIINTGFTCYKEALPTGLSFHGIKKYCY